MKSGHPVPLPDFKLGIQLYGLQDNFRKDMQGTLKALAGFGYQGIELIPPYETDAATHSGVEWLVVEFHPGLANPLEMARLCLEGVRGAL